MTGLTVDIGAKRFASAHVLGEIRFTLGTGERVAVLGDSGIGKSTLLAIIVGYDTDFEGRIIRPDGRAAMVFQTPRLLPWRTLAENIAVTPGAGTRARARELLGEVGLGAAAEQYPETVSLGMQRRAALVRALAISPSLILLDEPLVSLDPETATSVRDLMVQILDRTLATCVMATHDRREALAVADRLIELGGRPARITSDRPSGLPRAERSNPRAIDDALARLFPSP